METRAIGADAGWLVRRVRRTTADPARPPIRHSVVAIGGIGHGSPAMDRFEAFRERLLDTLGGDAAGRQPHRGPLRIVGGGHGRNGAFRGAPGD